MILCNREIERALGRGDLVIEPRPPALRRDDLGPYDTVAVNLRLAGSLMVPRGDQPFTFDLRRGGIARFLADTYEQVDIDRNGGYALAPDCFVLGRTVERVALPLRPKGRTLAARIEGRSSFARCGLIVHFTAPTIHSGFDGTITFEMKNLGAYPITLYPNLAVAQLIVERVQGMPVARPSQFQGQDTPAGTRKGVDAAAGYGPAPLASHFIVSPTRAWEAAL